MEDISTLVLLDPSMSSLPSVLFLLMHLFSDLRVDLFSAIELLLSFGFGVYFGKTRFQFCFGGMVSTGTRVIMFISGYYLIGVVGGQANSIGLFGGHCLDGAS